MAKATTFHANINTHNDIAHKSTKTIKRKIQSQKEGNKNTTKN